MSNNRAVGGSENPTTGSTLLIQTHRSLRGHELSMRGNHGAHAIRVVDSLDGAVTLDQDMSNVPNLDGVRDLGAYESQQRAGGVGDTIFCDGFDSA